MQSKLWAKLLVAAQNSMQVVCLGEGSPSPLNRKVNGLPRKAPMFLCPLEAINVTLYCAAHEQVQKNIGKICITRLYLLSLWQKLSADKRLL